MTDVFSKTRDYLTQSGIAHIFPSFIEEINSYEDYFSSHPLVDKMKQQSNQMFQAVINDNSTRRPLYSLEWDISALQNDYLKSHKLIIEPIPIQDKRIYCDQLNLNLRRVTEYMGQLRVGNLEPILLVWIEFASTFFIIDGNHRFFASKLCGRKTIDAIILPPGIHLNYMASDESRMRYKVFHNLYIMRAPNPNCTVSEKMLDDNSIYPITGNEIKLGHTRFFRLFLLLLLARFKFFFPVASSI